MTYRGIAAACLLLLTTGSGAALAKAPQRADLRVASVAPDTASARPGAAMAVEHVVRNAGARRAKASTTRLFLSQDRRRSSGDLLLADVAVPAIRPGRRVTTTAVTELPQIASPGAWRVIACADVKRVVRERRERNNCRASAPVEVVEGSTLGTPQPALPPQPAPEPQPQPAPKPEQGLPSATPRVTVTGLSTAGAPAPAASSSAPAADCSGASCTLEAGAGTVTLAAVAAPRFRFTGWSGCADSGETTLDIVDPRSDVTCTANHVGRVVVSAVSGSGATGDPSVTSQSPHAVCQPGACTVDAGNGTVALEAAPAAAGHRFTGWTCTEAGTANVVIADPPADVACTASYVPRVNIEARRTGTGTGTVGATAEGPSTFCFRLSASCTVDAGDATVTLAATPAEGSLFAGWSGQQCTGGTLQGRDLVFIDSTASQSCDARFEPPVNVTVTPPQGPGQTVASTNSQWGHCPSMTKCTVPRGTGTVALRVIGADLRVVGWTGACSGTENPYLVVDPLADTTCSATTAETRSVSARIVEGQGTVSTSSPSAWSSCGNGTPAAAQTHCTVDRGGEIALSVQPAADWVVESVTGCSGSRSGNTVRFFSIQTNHNCDVRLVRTSAK